MGYLKNHLATVVMAVFSAVLSGLWFAFDGLLPGVQDSYINFVFMMAVPISWFLTFTCWIAQKSADFMKKWEGAHGHSEKKSLNNQSQRQYYTSEGKKASNSEIKEAKTELTDELNQLRDSVKLKDEEIERLKQEIANLETLVQIESLKSELANLKMLASQRKKRNKTKD